MNAVLMIAEHPEMTAILLPVIDLKENKIHWGFIDVRALTSAQRAALAWARCLWSGSQSSSQMADPFAGLKAMSPSLRVCVLNALAQFV